MGITIHYQGVVEKEDTVDKIMGEVRDIAEEAGIDNEVYKEDGHVGKSTTLCLLEDEEDEEIEKYRDYIEDKPYYGMEVEKASRQQIEDFGGDFCDKISEGYEPGKAVLLRKWHYSFGSGRITQDEEPSVKKGVILQPSPYAESLNISFFKLPDGKWKIHEFMKTQAFEKKEVRPNVKAHVFAIRLLTYIKRRYVPDMRINDEADFYFTEEQRRENIERWKEHHNDPDSPYHDMAEEKIEEWKNKEKGNPDNIIKSYGANLQVMNGMNNLLKGLGLEDKDIKTKQWIEDDRSDVVERITTIYKGNSAKDTLEKNGEDILSVKRDR